MVFDNIVSQWKKGFMLLIIVFLINFLLVQAAIKYLQPLSFDSIISAFKTNQIFTITFLISLLLMPYIYGLAMEQIDKRIR